MNGRNGNGPGGARGGFSLIEVALALMIAASGLIAAFGLFPASLRQSVDAHAYMVESTFASSALETIAANVRQIDDIAVWNDPAQWFEKAVSTGFGTGLKLYGASELHDGFEAARQKVGPFHLPTLAVAEGYKEKANDALREVWYFGREEERLDTDVPSGSELVEPAQWIARIHVLKRPARSGGVVQDGSRIANRYLVTIVSTPDVSPARYIENASYSQEYAFVRRP